MRGKPVIKWIASPMVWLEPTDHSTDCYFCLTKIKGFNKNNRSHIKYPNIDTVCRPVPNNPKVPPPNPPKFAVHSITEEIEPTPSTSMSGNIHMEFKVEPEYTFEPDEIMEITPNEPHRITQAELNDLIRDLDLPKNKSKLLGSRLNE